MRFRKLRIAWSVCWGLLCLFLLVVFVWNDFQGFWISIRWGELYLGIGGGIIAFSFGKSMGIVIPLFAAIPMTAIAALAPWLSFRFSLRTLLIVITLAAVVLGLAVWTANG